MSDGRHDDDEDIAFEEPPPISRNRPSKPTLLEQAGLDIVDEKVAFFDFDVDPDVLLFAGIDTTENRNPRKDDDAEGPSWNIGEMAKTFFGRTAYWVRWREKLGDIDTYNGQPIADRRKGPLNPKTGKEAGARYYHLEDIEMIARALAERSKISSRELHRALIALKIQGVIHNYIEDE